MTDCVDWLDFKRFCHSMAAAVNRWSTRESELARSCCCSGFSKDFRCHSRWKQWFLTKLSSAVQICWCWLATLQNEWEFDRRILGLSYICGAIWKDTDDAILHKWTRLWMVQLTFKFSQSHIAKMWRASFCVVDRRLEINQKVFWLPFIITQFGGKMLLSGE